MRCAVSLTSALIALLLAAPLSAGAATAKCDRLIATGGSDNPPFLWRDPQNPKRLIGANADLLKQITDSLDLKLELLHTGSAGEALEQVRSGRVDLLADAVLAPAELGYLDFVHPAIATLQLSAWVRNPPGFLYSNPAELAGRPGTYVKSSRFVATSQPLLKELNLSAAPSLAEGLKQLLAGKTDYVLYERYGAVARAGSQGLLEQVQRLDPPVATRAMHIAIAHDSACNGPWLRGQLAIKMTELRAAGVPQQLIVENLERWKKQHSNSGN